MLTSQLDSNTTCPSCKATLDAATDPSGNKSPKKGALTVCAYCSKILTFTESLQLRVMEDTEIYALPAATFLQVSELQKMATKFRGL